MSCRHENCKTISMQIVAGLRMRTTHLTLLINTSMNPVIYAIAIPEFKEILKAFFRCNLASKLREMRQDTNEVSVGWYKSMATGASCKILLSTVSPRPRKLMQRPQLFLVMIIIKMYLPVIPLLLHNISNYLSSSNIQIGEYVMPA